MTPLGIYLAISLLFVMITILEFAIVILFRRNLEIVKGYSKVSSQKMNPIDIDEINQTIKDEKRVGVRPKEPEHGNCSNISLSTRMDMIVFGLFTFGFLMFNLLYWNICLSI